MLNPPGVKYELADKARGIVYGGVGLMVKLAREVGLVAAMDRRLHLLQMHLPDHESDHVLNVALNALCDATCLQDMELRRNDEVFLDALGAEAIPDPTTAGDFCRRFDLDDLDDLRDAIDDARLHVWARQASEFFEEAVIDIDSTLVVTTGECKEGMDISYKGTWGYHPLLVTLANTGEVLNLVNRSGNRPSEEGAAAEADRAIALGRRAGFRQVRLRGDTAFSQTQHLDHWDGWGVRFQFGYDARPNLVNRAENLAASAWKRLKRPPAYTRQGPPRTRPRNVKRQVIRQRAFLHQELHSEPVAEFDDRPGACRQAYRMIVVRKNLSIAQGEQCLFDDLRYFFYISNDRSRSAENILAEAHERCGEQENLIEQLKNGIHALRVPLYDLVSNWAYMVIASLAWTLKAWFALTLPPSAREELLHMEFKRFLYALIRIPCQIVRAARRITVRLLAYTRYVHLLFRSLDATARLGFS